MAESPLEIMVFVANPDGFEGWAFDRKLERYQRVMEWHDYVAKLNPVKISHVWASTQVLSQTRLSPLQDLYVAVYRVGSLAEFDELMYGDPLRDCSIYTTILLTSLERDRQDDVKRLEQSREALIRARPEEAARQLEGQRIFFKQEPSYVGKFDMAKPINAPVSYLIDPFVPKVERPLEVLIYGMNPPEYQAWDDARKLIHYEKVLWWHDHIAEMMHDGRVSQVWGTHDFCDAGLLSYRSASAVTIYRAKDLDEFDETYRLDPLRDHGRFLSIILKPIDEQRKLDEARLTNAVAREHRLALMRKTLARY